MMYDHLPQLAPDRQPSGPALTKEAILAKKERAEKIYEELASTFEQGSLCDNTFF